ncbi:MAG: hypothetical protein FWC36_01720 [Spirochaetes bacterium]|nr:hypothetical protein [Spirochaetota bacterium]
MKVYPVNAIEAALLLSPQIASWSNTKDLYSKYISYQVDFKSNEITLIGEWDSIIEMDTVILGNTNALSGKLKLCSRNGIILDKEIALTEYINIIYTEKQKINKFELTLRGDEDISIGYLFVGKEWILPRFVVLPTKALNLRNESGRTFTGQVRGIPAETLKSFAAEFARIKNEEKTIFDDYINGVQTVIPHVIDPYPEAHEEFEPFFATVEDYGEAQKRAENNFYWNVACSWLEAK